ncbi:disease resistance protein RML1A-like isoform X1 [Brassica napus]|uniref:disease resistance protein RML1A-like isoform X1 n=1 Tax=Brassica napus TaxID=3708 RepID=UPI002078B52F|nr:disease resistance protein RML1A-like isoform X1 [Brassica napus]
MLQWWCLFKFRLATFVRKNEAKMIEKIAADVSNELNVTPSKDFDGMVGMEAHLRKINSYIRLESDEVKMIGIHGPGGIGKTTIARALFNQLSVDFQLKCFFGNLKGSYGSDGIVDHDSKLCLQSQILSKVLKQKDLKIHHLGAIKERLQDQRVLIVLDDVDDLEQLEALAKEPSWFGAGSRIVVTTEDRKILKAHWVKNIYHVAYPSGKEALEILCLSAFKQSSPRDGYKDLAKKVAYLCGNLPLGLHVVGLSLRGDSKHEWENQLSKLKSSLDRKIGDVLKVGYDRLSDTDQSLFLHIAFFFNNQAVDHVTTMLADGNLDVKNGLKTLVDRSLVYVSTSGCITMHCLLQQLGRKIVHKQSDDPGKRQFLEEAFEIHNVLANNTGTGSVLGISFDSSKMNEVSISKRAFEGMHNLQFLRIYGRYINALQISEDMEYLPRLRLLQWNAYPRKSLPPAFQLERLVELHMPMSNLERLWGGIQPLTNLKDINLGYSKNLIEIPDLSKATNLETLTLTSCSSLVELTSSIRNLHKLKKLMMMGCVKLQVIPTNINLASLEEVNMSDCSGLRSYPDISINIKDLDVENTHMEAHPSIGDCLPLLEWLRIGGINLKRLTHVPESVTHLDLSNSGLEKLPYCIIGLSRLESLFVYRCRKLVSLLGLPRSLKYINANDCESLERVSFVFSDSLREIEFQNCLKLDEESRRVIMQEKVYDSICLPGNEVPAEFIHKATGNSIIIPMDVDGNASFSIYSRLGFKACLLLSPIKYSHLDIACLITKGGVTIRKLKWDSINVSHFLTEHLFICGGNLVPGRPSLDGTANDILFEFSCRDSFKIIECGLQILSGETVWTGGSRDHHTYGDGNYEPEAVQVSQREKVQSSKYKCCWSWLEKLCSGKEDEEHDDFFEFSDFLEYYEFEEITDTTTGSTPIMTRRRIYY